MRASRAARRTPRRRTRARGSGSPRCRPRRRCASSRASRRRRRRSRSASAKTRKRRVAAQLHRHPQHLVRGVRDEPPPHLGRAGERELAQPRIADQRAGHRLGMPGREHVEHPGWQPRLDRASAPAARRERRERGRLEHHRAPAAIAGAILRVAMASGKFHGVMNRHGPTGRLATSSRDAAVRRRLHTARRSAAPARRTSAGTPRRTRPRRASLGQRLAHLQRHQQREVLGPLHDELEGLPQNLRTLTRRRLRPRRLSRVRRRQRFFAVGDRGAGDRLQQRAGRGIVDVERPAVRGRPPPAVDQKSCRNRVQKPSLLLLRNSRSHPSTRPRLPAPHNPASPNGVAKVAERCSSACRAPMLDP